MKNVALFVGNDIFSRWCAGSDRRPERRVCLYGVFSPRKRRAHAGAGGSPPGLYEREVLNDFVFPFVGRNAAACEGAYQPPALFPPPPGSKRIAFSTSTTPRLSAARAYGWGDLPALLSEILRRLCARLQPTRQAALEPASGDLPRYRG